MLRFAEERDLLAHRRITHSDAILSGISVPEEPELPKQQGTCLLCDFVCDDQGDLIEHMETHTGDTLFTCDVCDERLGSLAALDSHLETHNDVTVLEDSDPIGTDADADQGDSVAPSQMLHSPELAVDSVTDSPSKGSPVADFSEGKPEPDVVEVLNELQSNDKAEQVLCTVCGENFTKDSVQQQQSKTDHICRKCFRSCNELSSTSENQVLDTHTQQRLSSLSDSRSASPVEASNMQFSCLVCDFSCGVQSELVQHMNSHSGEILFVCDECDETFSTQSALDAHMKIHDDGCSFECTSENGSERFVKEQDSAAHGAANSEKETDEKEESNPTEQEGHFMCLVCNFVCNGEPNMIEHMQSHSEEPTHTCVFCEETFSTLDLLKAHAKKHFDSKVYRCSDCSVDFVSEQLLAEHRKTDHPELRFVCESGAEAEHFMCLVCNYVCSGERVMISHMQTHSKEMLHVCSVCDEAFLAQDSLDAHKQKHEQAGEKGSPLFACGICNESFACCKSLQAHIKTHESKVANQFVCGICDLIFGSKEALDTHVNVHDEIPPVSGHVYCSLCDIKFGSVESLTAHVEKHPKEKDFACSMCDEAFYVETALDKHMRSHPSGKPSDVVNGPLFECSVCNVQTVSERGMASHMRSHSNKGEAFSCSVCRLTFAIRDSLVVHMRTHTGEHPYKCVTCNKTFTRKSTFRAHRRTHDDRKQFKCAHCRVSFSGRHKCQALQPTRFPRTLKCDFCVEIFTCTAALNAHMLKNHGRSKPDFSV